MVKENTRTHIFRERERERDKRREKTYSGECNRHFRVLPEQRETERGERERGKGVKGKDKKSE